MKQVTLEQITQMVRENKEFKIRVTPETSGLVQKAIFAGGGGWCVPEHKKVQKTNKPFLYYMSRGWKNGIWLYQDANKQDFLQYPDVEEVILVQQKTFQTQEEIWDWLKEGGCLVNRINKLHYKKLHEGFVSNFDVETNAFIDRSDTGFAYTQDWSEYTPTVKKEWYENIPEQGVLCYVSHEDTTKPYISVITSYNRNHFRTSEGCMYKKAIPLTEEEVKQFIYKED
jgi:hypothetical protein